MRVYNLGASSKALLPSALVRAALALGLIVCAAAVNAQNADVGAPSPDIRALQEQAQKLHEQGEDEQAAALAEKALALAGSTLGADHADTIESLQKLGLLYEAQGLPGKAEPLLKAALEGFERTRGADDVQTLISAADLGSFYRIQGRYDEAEPLYERAHAGFGRLLGADNPRTLASAAALAEVTFHRSEWQRALDLWRSSTAAITVATLRDLDDRALDAKPKDNAEDAASQFVGLVKAAYRLTPQGGMPDPDLASETFKAAQWALRARSAPSLTRLAQAVAASNPALSALLRARQDLASEWQKRERLLNAASLPTAANGDAGAQAEKAAGLAAIDAKIKATDKELAETFPGYMDLANPAPVSVEEVQSLLGDEEALVLTLDTDEFGPVPEESFIWFVTRTTSRWVRSGMGTPTLLHHVRTLRCGLDEAAWERGYCEVLTGQTRTEADRKDAKPLPFDHALAHRLFEALFGQAGDLIRGKRVLAVPSGPLSQLPFQVLVTSSAAAGDKAWTWFIQDNALAVLPMASSLRTLRLQGRPSLAAKPMIGFANPLLTGPDGSYAQLAKDARDFKTCAAALGAPAASPDRPPGPVEIEMRDGHADVSSLRRQAPLPETAAELCAIAKDEQAAEQHIHLGARATEHAVKRLSETGELANYRIVHFAIPCALAGAAGQDAEPGLVLTPPEKARDGDDGYLTAAEIAALKLDADWVILSACDTGSEDAQKADALWLLARAFLHAGGRALLVSYWDANMETTVKLITGIVKRFAEDRPAGRAEALRQTVLALIGRGKAEAHPSVWAPFVLVGEGGAGRLQPGSDAQN